MEYDSRLEINGDEFVKDSLLHEVYELYTVSAMDIIAKRRGNYVEQA
jgi:hypothetical protein